jgi:hypothetical protein
MFQYWTKHLLSKTWCVYIATLSHSEKQDRKNKQGLFPIDKWTHSVPFFARRVGRLLLPSSRVKQIAVPGLPSIAYFPQHPTNGLRITYGVPLQMQHNDQISLPTEAVASWRIPSLFVQPSYNLITNKVASIIVCLTHRLLHGPRKPAL